MRNHEAHGRQRAGGYLYLDVLTGLAVLSLLIAAFTVAAGQQERGQRALAERRRLTMRAEEAIVRLQSGQSAGDGVTVNRVQDPAPAGQVWVKVSAAGAALEQREQASIFAVVPAAAVGKEARR